MSKFKFSPQTGHIVGTPSLLLAVRVHGNARLIRSLFMEARRSGFGIFGGKGRVGVPRGGRPPTYLLSVELASIGVTPTYLPPPP